MATHDYVISNASGAAVRADLNNALAAIVSNNSNATAPATTYAYQWWADTTNGVMKLRNAANTDWITLYQLDGEYTNITLEAGTNSAPSLRFVSDTNTGIYSPGADQVAITTGGTARVYVGSTGSVGIGSTTFSSVSGISGAKLQVLGGTIIGNDGASSNGSGWLAFDSACAAPTTSKPVIYHKAGTGLGIKSDYEINFEIGASDAVKIDNSKRLLVGTSTARTDYFNNSLTAMLQVEGTNSSGAVDRACVSIVNNNSLTVNESPVLVFGRSNGSTLNSKTIVGNGTRCGYISFQGADGSDLIDAASIAGEIDGTPNANDMPGRLVFSTTPDGQAAPVERLRITQDGTTQSTNNVTNFRCINNGGSGIALIYFQTSSAELGKIRINGAGVAYDTTSDYRLKENVEPITDATSRVQALKPWRFNFISHPDVTVDGFLAHEAQEVVPEAVGGEKDAVDDGGNPVYQSIDQSKLVPLLTAALQEAIAKIETLEAKVAALESPAAPAAPAPADEPAAEQS